ncbi:MAG: hypothetical protein ACYCSG_03290 [Thermoplasmataceae archaeon]
MICEKKDTTGKEMSYPENSSFLIMSIPGNVGNFSLVINMGKK